MKIVPIQDAVDLVLEHDITEIVPGGFKGPAFKRGHVIQAEDVERLRNLGKENIAVLDLAPGMVHEDDAALRLASAVAGTGVVISEPSEGKVNLVAARDGLLKIDVARLHQINAIEDVMLATCHTNRAVSRGQTVAGTRVIPLIVADSSLREVEVLCPSHRPLVSVIPLKRKKVGIVTTGSEVYHDRIDDRFGPVVMDKVVSLGSRVLRQILVPDDIAMTVEAIQALIDEGAELVLVTGGMSVDPDDVTPASIQAVGAEVVAYGAPVLPGAMFMLAYLGNVPIVGLPGCVMYHKTSIFDLVLPRLLAGERLRRVDLISLGHGGLCLGCQPCRYPECGFGT